MSRVQPRLSTVRPPRLCAPPSDVREQQARQRRRARLRCRGGISLEEDDGALARALLRVEEGVECDAALRVEEDCVQRAAWAERGVRGWDVSGEDRSAKNDVLHI